MSCDNDDYNQWLEETGSIDSGETRGWYDCPENERANYIENNRDWWESDW